MFYRYNTEQEDAIQRIYENTLSHEIHEHIGFEKNTLSHEIHWF